MISLCINTRNDEPYLERCLARFVGSVAEVIVVDADSTDRTVEVARARGARVVHSQHPDHLAEMRNEALDLATQPWILALDADETLAGRDLRLLGTIAGGALCHAYRLPVRNYARRSARFDRWHPCREPCVDASGAGGWTVCFKVAVFPNRPDLRFRHRAGESVEPALAESGLPVHPAALTLHRLRGMEDSLRAMARDVRDEHLLRSAMRESPDEGRIALELSRLLRRRDRWEEARGVVEELCRRHPNAVEVNVERALVCCIMGENEAAAGAARSVLDSEANRSECWEALALACLRMECLEEALQAARKAVSTGPRSPGGYHALGLCMAAMNQSHAAGEMFRKALQCDPRHEPSLLRLTRLGLCTYGCPEQ